MSKVVDPGESVMDPAQLPAVVVDSGKLYVPALGFVDANQIDH